MEDLTRLFSGITNINVSTGVHFGVFALNDCNPDWDIFTDFLNDGRNLTMEVALEYWQADHPGVDDEEFYEDYESDEDTYYLETEGMKLQLSTLGGAYNIWVFDSPHTKQCALCSPCCPGAGDLNTSGDFTTYSLPAEWVA